MSERLAARGIALLAALAMLGGTACAGTGAAGAGQPAPLVTVDDLPLAGAASRGDAGARRRRPRRCSRC